MILQLYMYLLGKYAILSCFSNFQSGKAKPNSTHRISRLDTKQEYYTDTGP